jgi:CRP/FNR family transcriptional regulator, anaerobic regulatory protein
MSARSRSTLAETVASWQQSSCSSCTAYELNLCRAAREAWPSGAPAKLEQSAHTVPARRIICREHELQDAVPIICEGWAASVIMLSDSSRQILSFLLPGDMVSTTLLFEAQPHCLIEAITDVRYRTFCRAELKAVLFKNLSLFDSFAKAWVEEKVRADQLIADLGRRTADERIARLILNLTERLSQRGLTQSNPTEMDFPLRQHHIADATGLTPVHVSKSALGVQARRPHQDQRSLIGNPRSCRFSARRQYAVAMSFPGKATSRRPVILATRQRSMRDGVEPVAVPANGFRRSRVRCACGAGRSDVGVTPR